MNNTSNLYGKKILLFGGISGIGLATAKVALEEGASVIVVSSRQESVDRALSELKERAEGYTLDLTKEDRIKKFFGTVGKFDHMVFTAGETFMLESIENMDINRAKEAFNLRYWGAYMAATT
jgi:NAD(P)-dependent dehydrogenase (short-subunit alcohol dehydrogenase family)